MKKTKKANLKCCLRKKDTKHYESFVHFNLEKVGFCY